MGIVVDKIVKQELHGPFIIENMMYVELQVRRTLSTLADIRPVSKEACVTFQTQFFFHLIWDRLLPLPYPLVHFHDNLNSAVGSMSQGGPEYGIAGNDHL